MSDAMRRVARHVAAVLRQQLKQKKRLGETGLSNPPYLYKIRRKGGRRFLVLDEYEVRVARRVYELSPDYSYDAIRQFLVSKGVKSRRGGDLGCSQLRAMHLRYVGLLGSGLIPDALKPRI